MKRKYKLIIYTIFFIGIIIFSIFFYKAPDDDYTITFVDVGQGDSAVIKGKDTNILIDAGVHKDARNIRIALDRLNIKRIDLAVISHLDSDHVSGMSRIINDYKVKKIITSKIADRYLPTSTGLDEFNVALELKKVPIYMVEAGERFKFKDIDISVLSPGEEYGDSNDDSVVLKVKCGMKTLLFTGDISSKVEKNLLKRKELKSDVLKVAHHGSYNSTSEDFLNRVNPSYAVVSVSKFNNYNLPNVTVMKRLYGYGCEVFRTDEMGSITFHIKGNNIRTESEK